MQIINLYECKRLKIVKALLQIKKQYSLIMKILGYEDCQLGYYPSMMLPLCLVLEMLLTLPISWFPHLHAQNKRLALQGGFEHTC